MVAEALGINAYPRGSGGGRGVIELRLYRFCQRISPVTTTHQDRRAGVLPFLECDAETLKWDLTCQRRDDGRDGFRPRLAAPCPFV